MKSVRMTSVGASSPPARICSRSRNWPSRFFGRPSLGTANTTTGAGIAEATGAVLSVRMGSRRLSALGCIPGADLRVRLLQLGLGPLRGILGLHPLDGLRVHVHEDVLHERLARLAARPGCGA